MYSKYQKYQKHLIYKKIFKSIKSVENVRKYQGHYLNGIMNYTKSYKIISYYII